MRDIYRLACVIDSDHIPQKLGWLTTSCERQKQGMGCHVSAEGDLASVGHVKTLPLLLQGYHEPATDGNGRP